MHEAVTQLRGEAGERQLFRQPEVSVVANGAGTTVGCALLTRGNLPFPGWGKLVGVITDAAAIMYAFAPVSLAALHKSDPDRPRRYRLPAPKFMLPAGFCAANLILYWSGFDVIWKLVAMVFVGRLLFEYASRRPRADRPDIDWRSASWIYPWLIGVLTISLLGRYGCHDVLPDWIDLLAVIQ